MASGILAAITLMSAVAGTETYEYDALGRLKSTSQTDGTTVEYDLDAAGNRETVTTTIVPGSVQFSAATYSVGEAGASITITVTRVSGNVGAISVAYGTSNGTASAGSDYTATSGTLNWSTGDTTSKTFLVSITNDAVYEPNETFTVSLSNPTNGASLGSPSAATVTITNDDPVPPSGSLQLTASSYSIAESAGSVTISVSRTGGTFGAATINFATSNGTAVAGSDYTAVSGTLNWANADAASKTFAVTITNDAVYESNETFTVSISSPTGGASLGSPTSATVTITNDDPAPPVGTLQLTASSYSVAEGSGGATISVSRTGGSFGAASISYSTSNGTASAGSDYTASSGPLNWTDGDAANKTFSVPILDDSAAETSETFTVTLSGASGAALGSPASGTVTITDNEIVTLSPSATTTYPTSIVFSITQLATLNGNAATIQSMTVPGGCGSRTIAGGGQSVTYTPPNYSYNYCVSEAPPPMACEVPYVIRKTSTGQDYAGTAHISVEARAIAVPNPCP